MGSVAYIIVWVARGNWWEKVMDKIKIWNTKYALTSGITTHMVKPRDDEYASVERTTESYGYLLSKGDWHTTLESAVERAEEMRIKRLISLDKQAKKIAALDFSKVKGL